MLRNSIACCIAEAMPSRSSWVSGMILVLMPSLAMGSFCSQVGTRRSWACLPEAPLQAAYRWSASQRQWSCQTRQGKASDKSNGRWPACPPDHQASGIAHHQFAARYRYCCGTGGVAPNMGTLGETQTDAPGDSISFSGLDTVPPQNHNSILLVSHVACVSHCLKPVTTLLAKHVA